MSYAQDPPIILEEKYRPAAECAFPVKVAGFPIGYVSVRTDGEVVLKVDSIDLKNQIKTALLTLR